MVPILWTGTCTPLFVVKIKSLDETEGWTKLLELVPDEGHGIVGHQLVSMAAWVADREREVISRRTGLAAKTTVISIPIRV